MSFIGTSYQLNALKADVQRVVNMFPVTNEVPGGKSVAYLDSIPGLTEFAPPVIRGNAIILETEYYILTEDGFHFLLESDVGDNDLLTENGDYLITEGGFRITT